MKPPAALSGASETGLVREWSWDFDGDGKVDRLGSSVSWNYSKPGNFNTTLFVTDQVGHKSANRTMPMVYPLTCAPDRQIAKPAAPGEASRSALVHVQLAE